METFLKIAVYLSFSVFLSSCATGPKVIQADLSASPKCGMDGSMHHGDPQYALLDMSQARKAQIRLIDGKPFMPRNCDYYHVVMPPGEHTIHFVYLKSMYLLHPRGRDPVALKFTADTGKIYQVFVEKHPLRSLYNCRVEEAASGKILHEIDDCDSDVIRYPAMDEIFEAFGGREAYIQYQEEWWPEDDFEQLHRHLR
jgi:hypothetical protein